MNEIDGQHKRLRDSSSDTDSMKLQWLLHHAKLQRPNCLNLIENFNVLYRMYRFYVLPFKIF